MSVGDHNWKDKLEGDGSENLWGCKKCLVMISLPLRETVSIDVIIEKNAV